MVVSLMVSISQVLQIYDARMMLKYLTFIGFGAKALGNLCYASGFLSWLGTPLHVAGSLLLVKLIPEWYLLRAVEAIAFAAKKPKQIMEDYLIPALASYPDVLISTASLQSSGGIPLPETSIGSAVRKTNKALAKANSVTVAGLSTTTITFTAS